MPQLSQTLKNKLLIIYKLLGDLLFLLLLFFGLALVADSLIPGIVSSHISFLKILFAVAFNLAGLYAIGYAIDIQLAAPRDNKKTIVFLTIIGMLLVFNGLLKLNHYLAFFLLLVSLACGFFLWRMFFEE